ncbi:MAG TPA: hypothetical protein VHR45_07435 [Thermoanaerobaculia bacterium]|nr:hypothetical protein [Thermoanaerobaculia bacterium]
MAKKSRAVRPAAESGQAMPAAFAEGAVAGESAGRRAAAEGTSIGVETAGAAGAAVAAQVRDSVAPRSRAAASLKDIAVPPRRLAGV